MMQMKMFFLYLWKTRERRSEISGKWLGSEFSTMYYHHIFPKSSYPELAFSVSNIICVTGDEHATLENNGEAYDVCNKKREWLEQNWEEATEESKRMEERINRTLKGE